MRWPIRDFGANRSKPLTARGIVVLGHAALGLVPLELVLLGLVLQGLLFATSAEAQRFRDSGSNVPHSVPTSPPADASGTKFHDSHYGVRFQVPPGWSFTRRDREVSTFRLDARSAPSASEMRGVAIMSFNPFPQSVLSGALVYFSVSRHSDDKACAAQTTGPDGADAAPLDQQSIGGMPFLHGHDEHGGICVEARDEIYTAYRKGSCYRFDLALNTFCAISSGAAELSREQMHSIEAQMAGILSTVSLDWEKTGPQPVPVPEATPDLAPKPSPRHPIPAPAPPPKTSSTGLGA